MQASGFYIAAGSHIIQKQYATVDGMTATLQPQGVSATSTSHDESVYLRDSWSVGFVPGLTINAGLRWEFQQLKDPQGTTQINLWDNLSPRAGLVYDFTRKGRSKLFINYGRYYETLPLDIADRQFSGVGVGRQLGLPSCKPDMNGRFDPTTCQFATLTPDAVNGGAKTNVSPTLKGQYSDEIVLGARYDVGWDAVLGLDYVHRQLGRVIEDVSFDGGASFIVANPGGPVDSAAIAELQQVVANLDKQIGAASGSMAAALQKQRDQAAQRIAQYKSLAGSDKPTRDYNAVIASVQKRLSHHFTVLASYTYSRTLGNYPGLYDGARGQLDPNSSGLFDLHKLVVNTTGPLPTDRPHNLKVAAAYEIPIGGPSGENGLTIGVVFSVLSGRPILTLGGDPNYGNGVYILPRGAAGRTPTITQLDLHIAYWRQFSKGVRVELSWDTFNLINQRTPTEVDDQYTYDYVSPIENGKAEDLAYLRNQNGQPVTRNPNYAQPTAYQAPLSMRFGAKLSF